MTPHKALQHVHWFTGSPVHYCTRHTAPPQPLLAWTLLCRIPCRAVLAPSLRALYLALINDSGLSVPRIVRCPFQKTEEEEKTEEYVKPILLYIVDYRKVV